MIAAVADKATQCTLALTDLPKRDGGASTTSEGRCAGFGDTAMTSIHQTLIVATGIERAYSGVAVWT
jgi:hypothetical protein